MNSDNLNWLAKKVIDYLDATYNDPSYVSNKAASLRGQDSFQTLLWCRNLDSNNQRQFAKTLGISESDFKTTLAVIRILANS